MLPHLRYLLLVKRGFELFASHTQSCSPSLWVGLMEQPLVKNKRKLHQCIKCVFQESFLCLCVYMFMCVYMCVTHMHFETRGQWNVFNCSLSFFFLRQDLWLHLDPCKLTSQKNHRSLCLPHSRIYRYTLPYLDSPNPLSTGTWTQVLMLARQVNS